MSQASTKQIMFTILTYRAVSLSLPYISPFDLELAPSSRTALPTPFLPSSCPSSMAAIPISTFQHAYRKATASELNTSGVLHVGALYALDIVPASRRFIFEQQSHLRME